jgi:trehalose-6-phosphatase
VSLTTLLILISSLKIRCSNLAENRNSRTVRVRRGWTKKGKHYSFAKRKWGVMKILNPRYDLIGFIKKIGKASERVLILDYDEILSPYCDSRRRDIAATGVYSILAVLAQICTTRLILISRKQLKELVPLFGHKIQLEIWSSGGWECLKPDGTYMVEELNGLFSQGISEASICLRTIGLEDQYEQIPAGLSVSWPIRQMEEKGELRKEVWEKLVVLAKQTGLLIGEVEGGVELRAPDRSRTKLIEELLGETRKETAIAYLSGLPVDDVFKALKGKGLGVLVSEKPVETEADLWLKLPEELLEFLSNWITLTMEGLSQPKRYWSLSATK